MKLTIFMATMTFVMLGIAGPAQCQKEGKEPLPGAMQTADLIIYRPKFSPPLTAHPMVYINGRKLYSASRGAFFDLKITKFGKYDVTSDWNKSPVEVNLKPGDRAYVEISSSMSIPLVFIGGAATAGAQISKQAGRVQENRELLAQLAGYRKWNYRDADWYKDNDFVLVPGHVSLDPAALLEELRSRYGDDAMFAMDAIVENTIYDPALLNYMRRHVRAAVDVWVQDGVELRVLNSMAMVLGSTENQADRRLLESATKSKINLKLAHYAKNALARVSMLPPSVSQSRTGTGFANYYERADVFGRRLVLNYVLKNKYFDDELTAYFESHLNKKQAVYTKNSDEVKNLAYICRYLALSGKPSALALVQNVGDNAKTGRLRRYAKNALKYREKVISKAETDAQD